MITGDAIKGRGFMKCRASRRSSRASGIDEIKTATFAMWLRANAFNVRRPLTGRWKTSRPAEVVELQIR